mgnify:CR=1 FL=1
MYLIETMIIVICTVENIERARLIRYYIHCLDIVYLCFGYMDKGRYLSLYIIQRMDFDTSLMCTKVCLRKQFQTQVNRCRIEGIYISV